MQVLGAEPGFTSCHGRVIATLDYMWYTPRATVPAAPPTTLEQPRGSSASAQQAGAGSRSPSAAAAESAPSGSADGGGAEVRERRQTGAACDLPSSCQPEEAAAARPCSGAAVLPTDVCLNRVPGPWGPLGGPSGGPSGEPQDCGGELVPTRVAVMPGLGSLRCGLPAPEYPSDHISLVAEFSARLPAPGVPVPEAARPAVAMSAAAVPDVAAPAAAVASAATSAVTAPSALPEPGRPGHIFFDDD